jgi:hypothetical protein
LPWGNSFFGALIVSRIFLSHSSTNNAEAVALRDWLAANGWKDEIFLDLDPHPRWTFHFTPTSLLRPWSRPASP